MNGSGPSPLGFHRTRRDHQLRMFFSAAQRTSVGRPPWLRAHGNGRQEILHLLDEALHHGSEVLRLRHLEWPDSTPEDIDRKLVDFLDEMRTWFLLLEKLVSGGEDPRNAIQPLLESRLRLGLQLFHSARHAPPNLAPT